MDTMEEKVIEKLRDEAIKLMWFNPRETISMSIYAHVRPIFFERIIHDGELVGWLVTSCSNGEKEYLTQNGKRWKKSTGGKIPKSAVIIPFTFDAYKKFEKESESSS